MPDPRTTIDPELARLAAREALLRMLALAASDPTSKRFARARDPGLQELAAAAARHLAAEPALRRVALAPGEAEPAELDLGALLEALALPHERLVRDHDRVFGLVVSGECPPTETEYCPQTFTVYRSQRIADVAGFYRAFGVEPGRDVPERPDHVACELEFLAWLVAKERHARAQEGALWAERARTCRAAQRAFLEEHVAWWVPAFARALGGRARTLEPRAPLQAALSELLARWVPFERASLGVPPPTELVQARREGEPEPDACAGCSSAAGSESLPSSASAPARTESTAGRSSAPVAPSGPSGRAPSAQARASAAAATSPSAASTHSTSTAIFAQE